MQKPLELNIEEKMIERLESIANATKRSKSVLVEEALEEYLEDMELASRADKIYEDVCAGKMETIFHEELKRKYGIK
ncbi:MAG: hypothetical protein Nk1A_5750 [Endomicrobiia bacterium]|nr:MAG: hypothetical protein Nk1A_5750 [Endomicrobiia bacterium]